MHLKKLNELETRVNNTLISGTLSPQEVHVAMEVITQCGKARRSIECYRNMEGSFYINKAEEIFTKLMEGK